VLFNSGTATDNRLSRIGQADIIWRFTGSHVPSEKILPNVTNSPAAQTTEGVEVYARSHRGVQLSTLRHQLRGALGPYPIYLRILRWRHGSHNGIFGPDTEIVIEGYPRSGNTFSVTACEIAHGRKLRSADHLHAPAQVIMAARTRTPCLVLLRHPHDAILSYFIRFLHISVGQCMKDYVRFYETIHPYQVSYLLAHFESVTRDFGAVMKALNKKFGSQFAEFEHTPENEARCFDLVQRRYEARLGGGKPISEAIHSRPSEEKAKLKQQRTLAFRRELESPRLRSLRERTERLYQVLEAEADI